VSTKKGEFVADELTLQIGKEICPGYHLRRLLGRGGYGYVWEAEKEDHTLVALKFLPCGLGLAASKEIRAISALNHVRHPNLITIEKVWCQANYLVIEMKLADGNLLDLLNICQTEYGTALPADQTCFYLDQAAEGLDFLNMRHHSIDGRLVAIRHCDVKPSNILLFDDKVKLCDFGLSSLNTTPMQGHRKSGSLDFTAPEVFQSRLSEWTDQYSLAITYCVLRGDRLPFTDSPTQFVPGYTRPEPDLSMLTSAERPIIYRALSRVPQERWPNCKQLIAQLAKATA
jgi:serine/threonine protein kinase, bacterial